MNRYQFAKIVGWAGTVDSRKRMQRVLYLLQAVGCPLDADYYLHGPGVYSEDVARLTDQMVRVNLLEERAESDPPGQRYSYRLGENTLARIDEFEHTREGRAWSERMALFEMKARQLFKADLKELDVASTTLYFHRQGHDWPAAVARACQFKSLTRGSPAVERAEALARQIRMV